jgi:LmbE family N-acetylglucosaminyl deacetylase
MRLYPFLNNVISAGVMVSFLTVSVAVDAQAPTPYPSAFAEPLPVDRGAAAVRQSLKKLQTRASLIMVVAHPDDEDGGMLTYESRGQGADATLLTLNRGEGGQNVMSSDYWDQLGLVRTQELLAADDAYGIHQYWTRVADFGFSKSIEEALKTWGHDRVLYDCVRVVRMTRPLVVTSSFVGNVSDGHGHHQVAGLMAQEVYKAAGDPNIFPDQIKAGLRPWSPLKVYARVPFARVTEKGIYDYATGHWSPVRFRNYVTDTWIEGIPSTTVNIPEGEYSPLLARSYLTLAREGLANQKSQNGGIGAPPPQPFSSPYHLYATRVSPTPPEHESNFFEGVDISLVGIAGYAPANQQEMWRNRLNELNATVTEATVAFDATDPAKTALALAKGCKQVAGGCKVRYGTRARYQAEAVQRRARSGAGSQPDGDCGELE